jgi:hypothetical protein
MKKTFLILSFFLIGYAFNNSFAENESYSQWSNRQDFKTSFLGERGFDPNNYYHKEKTKKNIVVGFGTLRGAYE